MSVNIAGLVGHSVDSFFYDRCNIRLRLDNGVVIEPLTVFGVSFSCAEEFAEILERIGRRVMESVFVKDDFSWYVDITFGRDGSKECFKVRTRPDLIRRC